MSNMQKFERTPSDPVPDSDPGSLWKSGDGNASENGDKLAQHFLDLLIEDAGGRPSKKAVVEDHKDSALALFGELADDDDEDVEVEEVQISVDLAAAAICVARAVEPEIGLIKALRKETPVIVIETGDSAVNPDVEKVIKVCLLGRGAKFYGPTHFEKTVSKRRDQRCVVIFERSTPLTDREMNDWNKSFGHALQSRYPVIGIAADPATTLPKDLLRTVDYRISLDPLGASGISLVIRAVTGKEPSSPIDVDFARNADLSDLRLSIHMDRGADGSLEKLIEVVKKRLALTDLDPCLEDLHGYGEAKEIGLSIVADLTSYREGKIPWGAVDRGLLLGGPPGTGKTTFGKAFAKSAGMPLVIGSLAQWQAAREGHLGHCLAAMRESFATAKRKAPCILFIDELDSFGDRSSFNDHHKDYSTQVVNAFLELLDGASGRQGVFIVGATNNIGRIDPAITRSGRLDRTVEIPLPDIEALEKIIRFHLKGDLHSVDITSAAIAARGGSGADCEAWVRRARGTARRENREMCLDDVIAAIRAGRSALPEHVRTRVAIHEAGHAIVAYALGVGDPQSLTIHDWGGTTRITIEPREMTGADLIGSIAQLLGGREAEKLVYGDATAGSGGGESSDLAQATQLAAGFEGSFGLGSLGPIWLGSPDALLGVLRLSAIGARVSRILHHAGDQARRALIENRPALEFLAKELNDASYLDAKQVKAAVGKIRRVKIVPLSDDDAVGGDELSNREGAVDRWGAEGV